MFPSGLIAIARERLPTRDAALFAEKMALDFSLFAEKRITRVSNAKIKCPEARLVLAFRRAYVEYRDEALVSDKAIKKVIRSWVGYKSVDGENYLGLEISNLKKESALQLQANLAAAAEAKRLFDLGLLDIDNNNSSSGGGKEEERRVAAAAASNVYDEQQQLTNTNSLVEEDVDLFSRR